MRSFLHSDGRRASQSGRPGQSGSCQSCKRAVILCAGVAMIAAGLMSGEAGTVLDKAVRICLECIGIG